MSNTFSSLAMVKINWDNLKRDYIENFVPFLATLIYRKKYEQIDIDTICKDFEMEFGLSIPYHPMLSILNRAQKRSLIISCGYGRFIPNLEVVEKYDFTEASIEQEIKYQQVMRRFLNYCKNSYDMEITQGDADKIFISYLKEHDLDLLFALMDDSRLLPKVESSLSQKYLINKFVNEMYEIDPLVFSFIVDISIGYLFASVILYNDYQKFQGRLSKCNFYLDTGFLFCLLGTDGEYRKNAYVDFIKLLLDQHAKIFVFRHTYNELVGILEGCLYWISNPGYDPSRANRALIYFKSNNFSESDVEQFILEVESHLTQIGIQIIDAPKSTNSTILHIDEDKLINLIVTLYKLKDPSFDAEEKDWTIYQDIKSIAAINKLRKGLLPKTITEASDIFITTNSTLAMATRRYEIGEREKEQGHQSFFIPSALTDVFIGTIIWVNSPSKAIEINQKKIIANCYAALQPSRKWMKNLVDKVRDEEAKGNINEEDALILTESRLARNLLLDETQGDPDRFTEKTLDEVLTEIRSTLGKEESEKFQKEKEEYIQKIENIESELIESKKKTSSLNDQLVDSSQQQIKISGSIERFAERSAQIVGMLFLFAAGLIVAWFTIFQLYPNQFNISILWKNIVNILMAILAFLSLLCGFSFVSGKSRINKSVKNLIIRYFEKLQSDNK